MSKTKIRFSQPFEDKVEGWTFLNGNVRTESDLINMFNEQIVNPHHFDKKINASKKVLLVTAAFQKGHEHHDIHIIRAFEKLAIDPKWNGPFPENIQNLSLYTMFEQFQDKEKWLYQRYTEKQDQIKAIKKDYIGKNREYVHEIHGLCSKLKSKYPTLALYDFYNFYNYKDKIDILLDSKNKEIEAKLKDVNKLARSSIDTDICKTIKETLDHLVYKDDEIFSTCQHVEEFFLEKSGVTNSSFYKEQREALKERILSSASVFIFGGRVYVLVNRLRFYQLNEYFKQAMKMGTNIYGISAGAICQTDRFSLNFEEFSAGGYLRAADKGMGLVKNLWIFPHANDYNYIMETNKDILSFFALRCEGGAVIGLSEKSVLLCEKYKDPIDGNIYKRYSSVGEDPVLVFGQKGIICKMNKSDQLFTDGTKFYTNRNQVAQKDEMEELEKKYYLEYQSHIM